MPTLYSEVAVPRRVPLLHKPMVKFLLPAGRLIDDENMKSTVTILSSLNQLRFSRTR